MRFEFQQRLQKETDERRQRRRECWERAGTFGLWAAALVGLAAIISSSVDAARERAVIRAQIGEMRTEQRAWVYANVKPGGRIVWNQSHGLTVPVTFTMRNIGHLPAEYTWPVAEARTNAYFYAKGHDRAKSEARVCRAAVRNFGKSSHVGLTVFPGQAQPITLGLGISRQDWQGYKSGAYGPGITVFGCVVYPYGKHLVGSTGFSAIVLRTDPARPGVAVELPTDPTKVPAHLLHMARFPDGSSWRAR